MDKIPLIFQAQITQNNPMENSGFTLCRARVFYTGLNRNGSYIDKDFAESFITTAIGCPVVGLWDYEKKDFTDHSSSDRKKAYGFIPEEPHFAWEEVNDYDGITRYYATFDVVLWTKAFSEANEIITHPLSMEINPDTINGSFMVIDGEYCFKFTSAEMLGICVLGYNVEPCFEGASFLTVDEMKEFKRLFQLDKKQALLTYNSTNNEGEESMDEIKEEEKNPVEEFVAIRDDDIEEENTSEQIEEEENSNVVDSFENIEETNLPTEEENLESEIEKFTKHVAELEQTNKEFENKIQELEEKISKLEEINFSLNEYKSNKIKEEKQKIIESYKEVLNQEEINNLEINNFSVEDLNDKLAAMAYRKIANHESANFQFINTDIVDTYNDINSIVKKYKEN